MTYFHLPNLIRIYTICRQTNNSILTPLPCTPTHIMFHCFIHYSCNQSVNKKAHASMKFHFVVIVSEPALKMVPFELLPPWSPVKKFFFMLNGCPNAKISSDLVERIGFWNWLKFFDLIVLY